MSIVDFMNQAMDGLASRFGADSKLSSDRFDKVLSIERKITDEVVHLVLDLDHTLISSFEFGEAVGGHARSQYRSIGKGSAGSGGVSTVSPILANEYRDEYGLPEMYHAVISGVVVLIKLRPYVRRFIRTAFSKGYHLHVYTKGRRAYMREVLKLIDPTGELIKGRHISRDDEPAHFRDYQKDIGLVFASSSSAPNDDDDCVSSHDKHNISSKKYIVLDDSPHVWISGGAASKFPILTRAVVAARKYTFSDSFVTFLRNSQNPPNSSASSNYPQDGDSYLSTILVTFSEIVSKVYTFQESKEVTSSSTDNLGDTSSPLSRTSSTTVDSSSGDDEYLDPDLENRRIKFQLTNSAPSPKIQLTEEL